MKENRIEVHINRPISDVFEFTTNPNNTHKWIDSIKKEIVSNENKIGFKTTYTNWDNAGNKNIYGVVKFEKDKVFELTSISAYGYKSGNYNVRYTYDPITDSETRLEYYEWVEEGELESTFNQKSLDKLKEIIEK